MEPDNLDQNMESLLEEQSSENVPIIVDYYLKASSKEALYLVLEQLEIVSSDFFPQKPEEYILDEIGEIPGVEGFHVNLRSMVGEIVSENLAPFVLSPPSTPHTCWAQE